MPYLAPPPEPPAIVRSFPSETKASLPQPTETTSFADSPLSASRNAALLGSQISIGYTLQPEFSLSTQKIRIAPFDSRLTAEVTAPTPPIPLEKPSGGSSKIPIAPLSGGSLLELNADRQNYDAKRQIVTAEGHVVLRFQRALVDADRVQINLQNRLIVAEGNVALTRGDQVLRGQRFEYNLVQDKGSIDVASGEVYLPNAGSEFSQTLPTDAGAVTLPTRPLSDRIAINQPLQQISNPGGIQVVVGGGTNAANFPGPQAGGSLNRIRFQAEQIDFDSQGWSGRNVRITNDPFSPPELELRADTARYQKISDDESEIITSHSRLVFDQGLEIPIFQDRVSISKRRSSSGLLTFGYDNTERGGVFVEQGFDIISTPTLRFSVTPQYFIQKAIQEGSYINPSSFGVRANLDAVLSPTTTAEASAVFTTLNPTEFENKLRASLRVRQTIGTTLPHLLTLEYSYRDRLFNGSLGFQTVQSSLGAVLTSPIITLGDTGIRLSYQAGAQFINADTDRTNLLNPVRANNRINLARYQLSASVSKDFMLWQGKALPATPTEGMRYTPTPVVPYVQFVVGLTGVYSGYSSNDTQSSLSANFGLQGQFGNFSKPFLDYTGFNITYSQVFNSGLSPFLFDRQVDNRVLSAGITQQLYGPFRIGFQTSLNLDSGKEISTDYILEYSRRTYNIVLRYNPVVQIGSITFRINDFNWLGNPEPFAGSDVRPVVQGVSR
jgi:hypothetical protein